MKALNSLTKSQKVYLHTHSIDHVNLLPFCTYSEPNKKDLQENASLFSLDLNKKREKRSESSDPKEREAIQSKWSIERKELSATALIFCMH